jgi:hypothetical protein
MVFESHGLFHLVWKCQFQEEPLTLCFLKESEYFYNKTSTHHLIVTWKIPSNCWLSSQIPLTPIFNHVKLQEPLQVMMSKNFCYNTKDFGRLWQTLTDFDRLWQTLADFGRLWQALAGFGRLWQTLADFGRLWQTLADFVRLWQTLADFGRLWQPS